MQVSLVLLLGKIKGATHTHTDVEKTETGTDGEEKLLLFIGPQEMFCCYTRVRKLVMAYDTRCLRTMSDAGHR